MFWAAKQHARRVAAQLGISTGLVYLVGQPTVNWSDSDQERLFRQRRYFYYLSGTDEADCYLTYDIRADLLTLYVPNFDLRRAIWMGPTLTVEEAQARYDVDDVRYYDSLQGDIEHWAAKNNQTSPVYILHDSQRPTMVSMNFNLDAALLRPAMDAARGVKDEYEIELIRQANKISGLAHRKILESIGRMTSESEIEGSFLDTCVSHGARNQAYQLIAGSGENAAVLHYSKNNEPLEGRQLVCLDAGAEWNCYACDVTRTIPLSTTGDWPSVHARNIYHVVEEMQEECIKRIKIGVRFLDLHVLAHEIAIRRLLQFGILKGGSVEEIRKSGASTVFFPHGLGHHVGLEVHDVSGKSLTALRDDHYDAMLIPAIGHSPCTLSASYLEEGMVVTVEPGVYFSRFALANARKQPLAKYIDFEVAAEYVPVGGVRIEDDILVTKTGYENLTTAPKGNEMVEIIRRGIGN
ncbi:hypothetical protein AWENTII_010427 [Aspergillus wentii]|nr:hypothetical protein MW887_009610 [Aspergillus wentii]